MLQGWRKRRALRRAIKEKEEAVRASEVCARAEAVVEEIVGPYVRDGSAAIERMEEDEVAEPDIRVIPAARDAAGMTITPMSRWINLAVEYGYLEIHVGSQDWEEELATYLRSVVEGAYSEIGKRSRWSANVRMVFAQPDGNDLTCTSGGAYRGVENDYPPGERRYSPYR